MIGRLLCWLGLHRWVRLDPIDNFGKPHWYLNDVPDIVFRRRCSRCGVEEHFPWNEP